MSAPMTMRRFMDLADAYGGELARWPVAAREAARSLLETSAEARIVLEAARALDACLELPAPAAPGAGLRDALLRSRLKPLPQGHRASRWGRFEAVPSAAAGWREAWSWRFALPALALSLTLGIGLGFAVAPAAQADDADEDVLALARLDDTYAEYAEP